MYEVISWFDKASKITIVKRINDSIVFGTQLACVAHENKWKKRLQFVSFVKGIIEMKTQNKKVEIVSFDRFNCAVSLGSSPSNFCLQATRRVDCTILIGLIWGARYPPEHRVQKFYLTQ